MLQTSAFFHVLESQSGPLFVNTSVAIQQGISQGRQPKIPKDMNLE